MGAVRKILVAVDFSQHSIKAAEYAGALARELGAKLILINVYHQRDAYMLDNVAVRYPEFPVKKYLEANLQDRKNSLAELAGKLRQDGTDIAIQVRTGIPYKALLEEIEEKKPDLLVMGAKGRSDIVDVIVGSCAQKMFRRSPIPVLSVREDQPATG